jgi:hypothetical protein
MSLQQNDLHDLVYDIFEIDSFQSKMGDDKDIVTLSFSVKSKEPADDLMNFLESGYSFILDADSTVGEQSDGTYKVFVEIERNRKSHDQIQEIVDGVSQLSGIKEWKYRYYKSFKSRQYNDQNIAEDVPTDPNDYGIKVNESNMDNFKNFFNRSFLDEIDLKENTLFIKKKWADPLSFEVKDFGDKDDIINNIEESFNVNEFAEIIFLTKYIGDYNISKYGKKLIIENSGKALVVERHN